jgi:hypothetical protein
MYFSQARLSNAFLGYYSRWESGRWAVGRRIRPRLLLTTDY